jgi:hypothetical protein
MKLLKILSSLLVTSATLLVVLSSCSQGGGGGGGGTVAATPQACTANSTNNCSQVYPNGYTQPYINNGYFSCPSGFMLVSGWNTGPSCMPLSNYNQFYINYYNQYRANFYIYFTSGYSAYNHYYYGYGTSNPNATNMPQMSYSQQNAAISCDVRLQNRACAAGATCQAVTGGSTLGLCVSTTGAANGLSCYYNPYLRIQTCTYANYGYGFNNGGTR